MAEISTVLWDVGGVLLTDGWDRTERAAVLEQFALESVAFEQRHEIANDAWEKGLMTAEQYLLQTVFYEPRPFTPGAFLEAMMERSRLLPHGAMRILQELAASEEVELAILNNEARELNDYRIERFELGRYCDVFLVPATWGCASQTAKFLSWRWMCCNEIPKKWLSSTTGRETAPRRKLWEFMPSSIRTKASARRRWSVWAWVAA